MSTFAVKTIGCKVNAYESEYIISLFLNSSYKYVDDNADIFIINTCTVTNESDKKSRKIIHRLRKNNSDSIIIIMGCYIQNLFNEGKLEEIIPYADIIIGNKNKSKILEYLNVFNQTKEKIINVENMKEIDFEDMEISKEQNHTRAFIKIEDGCDNYCSYCVIPHVRGSVRSKKKEIILEEVKSLVDNGTKEIVLTGIHTGQYNDSGYDLFNLLLDLINIDELIRIRISSIEVVEINERIISILSNPKIASHLHIPLQSGSDKILKSMNRRYDTMYFKDKIDKIRKVNSNISISTDVIVGFPNETEKDFEDTYNFCNNMKFSKIHVFPYSDRYNTAASKIKDKVSEVEKKNRVSKLIELSNMLKQKYENNFVNKEVDILIENRKDDYYYGHTSNYLYLKLKGNYRINEVYSIKILNEAEINDIILL